MSAPGFTIHPDPLYAFDDIIDGYFPLEVSLGQMLDRLGVAEAVVELRHAPIMRIPGLAPTSPVPLRVERGDIGQIGQMALHLCRENTSLKLSGHGAWQWFSTDQQSDLFDPLTRLAEPAYVTGFTFERKPKETDPKTHQITAQRVNFEDLNTMKSARDALGANQMLGPFDGDQRITRKPGGHAPRRDCMWAILWKKDVS